MTSRSTRNKVKFQGISAYADLKKAQNHLVQLAALADNRSPYISEDLPQIIAALEMVTEALDKFTQEL